MKIRDNTIKAIFVLALISMTVSCDTISIYQDNTQQPMQKESNTQSTTSTSTDTKSTYPSRTMITRDGIGCKNNKLFIYINGKIQHDKSSITMMGVDGNNIKVLFKFKDGVFITNTVDSGIYILNIILVDMHGNKHDYQYAREC